MQTARIAEWNSERGYGYLNSIEGRLFLHVRDFTARHKKPEEGDVIRFLVGEDRKGRKCAVEAVHAYEGGKVTVMNVVWLFLLMFLPVLASFSLDLNPWLLGGYALFMAVVTFMLYALDKHSAREGSSRISETTLHFFELIGGWPGAFLAQRRLRHKCMKAKYLVIFWAIVALYQYIAIDFMHDWPIAGTLLEQVGLTVEALQQ